MFPNVNLRLVYHFNLCMFKKNSAPLRLTLRWVSVL